MQRISDTLATKPRRAGASPDAIMAHYDAKSSNFSSAATIGSQISGNSLSGKILSVMRAGTLRNDSDHYYRTLRIWDHNLAACHDQACALVGEATVKDFRQYLRISASGFKRGHICLLRMSFLKR